MNCEFCGGAVPEAPVSGYHSGVDMFGVRFHVECFKLAIKALAQHLPKPSPVLAVQWGTRNEFKVIAKDAESHAPAVTYTTRGQASTRALELDEKAGRRFLIVQVIGETVRQ